ncbi:universal stress protein [Haloarchaeobius iranensis]|uniref:Nucleotide-binding universal stress protein, UspA family n=1 Tax=Haloarchaeobius iranensis TaxID=996166 RepID=A0A1G9YQP6_9EURY|nr:universal stress protein [Haloarchaeobius iranensis]SDN10915.1 Nucleotide-binding universal stress protein, UspA family [Haloarchaeobius iranensis]
MYDTVLVPTDGSDHAIRAAEHGSYLAVLFDATVHVVSASDPDDIDNRAAGGDDEAAATEGEAEAAAAIDTVTGVLGETVEVETAVLEGAPEEAILGYADENDIDLLAMGTHGRTGVHRYVTGSVTESVVRDANAPVLTVRSVEDSRVDGSYDDVLVPTDGSDEAGRAVEHGLAIAAEAGATVHVVNVVDVAGLGASPEYTMPTSVLSDLESSGESAADAIAARARDAGLEARTAVRHGSPGWELLDYAAEFEIDLITMGTAGRSGIDRFLLGSTTERLIRHADVPVVAVNAGRPGSE